MSSSPRHRVPENNRRRPSSGSGGSSRRTKLRVSLVVTAAAAVAAAVLPFAISRSADTAAGAAQFGGSHRSTHRVAAVESHRRQATPSATPTPRACPSSPNRAATLWSNSLRPKVASSDTDSPATLGVMVVPSKSGEVTGVAFWKGSGNGGVHTASLWTDRKRLASGTFRDETASGWQWLTFAHPVQVQAGQHLLATYRAPEGHFAYTPGVITPGGICSGPLRATDGTLWSNHRHDRHGLTSRTTNYFVNLRFVPAGATDPKPTQSPTSKPTAQPTTSKPTVQPTTPKPTHSQTPTPKPTAKPTTSAPPSSSSAWPDASNTGVPAGTTLHACSGNLNSSGTYDACKFSGGVTIGANNVHITRSQINGQVVAGNGKQTGLVISDTEINCHCMSTGSTTPPAVAFSNFTLLRDNIYNAGHGVQINNNAVVEDSYIHGLGANNGAHKDAIISNGGGNAVIKHNNLECAADACSAAIGLFGDFAPIKNWTITDNLLNTTGGYCLYGGDASGGSKPYPTASGIVVKNNQFGKKDWPKCGQYGPVTYFGNHSGNEWSGNTWQGTAVAITP